MFQFHEKVRIYIDRIRIDVDDVVDLFCTDSIYWQVNRQIASDVHWQLQWQVSEQVSEQVYDQLMDDFK